MPRVKRFFPLVVWPVMIATIPSWAADTPSGYAPAPAAAAGMLQVFGGLLLVLAVVVGLAWALKRLGAHPQRATGALKVIGGAAVGQRERVVLIEVGATWVLIGVAQGHVRTLHSMPRAEKLKAAAGTPPASGGFAAWLQQLTERRAHD